MFLKEDFYAYQGWKTYTCEKLLQFKIKLFSNWIYYRI